MSKPKTAAVVKEEPVIDWDKHSGATGLEQVKSDDLGLPFLMILQSNNPELKKISPKYIQGAQIGDIINTLTREVVYTQGGEPIEVIPCAYDRLYVEWKTRESGGGLVRSHRESTILEETKKNEKEQDVLPNGNIVVNTAYFFCRGVDTDARMIIGMSSTQLKKSRNWLNMAMSRKSPSGRTLPLFSHTYRLSTVHEQNAKGDWYGWKIELGEPVVMPDVVNDCAQLAQHTASTARKLIENGTPAQEDTQY